MPIPETLHLDLRRIAGGPQLAFRLSIHERESGWFLQTPSRDVDQWLRDTCGRWLEELSPQLEPGLFRFVDEDAVLAFYAFCGRPSPERTSREIEEAAERREAMASRREAHPLRSVDLNRVPWPSSGPRVVEPMRVLEVHEGLEESWAFDALHIMAPGHVLLGGGRGRIALTTDGGVSWSENKVESPHGIRAFWGPADDLHVVGQSGAAHSVDGGRSWSTRLSFERGAVGRVAGTSRTRRFALDGGWLLVSADPRGGWVEAGPVLEHGSFVESGLWVGERELVACDVAGRLILSIDDGRSFEDVPTRTDEREGFGAIAAAEGVLIVVGKGGTRRKRPRILRSTDSGRSFEEADVPDVGSPDCRLLDVWGGGDNDWWACGQDGVLLHSSDAGIHWGQVDLATDEDLLSVRGLPGGEMWLLGDETLWRSETPPPLPERVIRGLWSE